MSFINTKIIYPLLTILSMKKRSFEALGEQIDKSGETVKRRLISADDSKNISHMVAQRLFKGCAFLIMPVGRYALREGVFNGYGWCRQKF